MSQRNQHNKFISAEAKMRAGLITFVVCLGTVFTSMYFSDESIEIFDIFMVDVYKAINKPIEKVVSIIDTVSNFVHYQQKIEDLQKVNDQLQSDNVRLAILERENKELIALNKYIKPLKVRYLSTNIINITPDQFGSKLAVDVGYNHGVNNGYAIVTSEGIIGRINKVSDNKSDVLLWNNINFKVPVILLKSGIRCIASGSDNSLDMELLYLSNQDELVDGEMAVTSGEGGILPFGIKVGTVDLINSVNDEYYLKPAARLDAFAIVAIAMMSSSVNTNKGM